MHNFRQQKSGRLVSLTGDLGEMVNRFWQTLPAAAVLNAIDLLLESAKDRDQGQRMQVSFSARGGKPGSFSSAYQLRLFQVLPVLEQLDKSRAEGLLKENESMRAMLTQYPQGVLSLNPKASHQGGDFGIYTSEYSMENDPAMTAASQARQQLHAEIKRPHRPDLGRALKGP